MEHEEEMKEKDAAADRALSPSNNSGKITISKSVIKVSDTLLVFYVVARCDS